MVVKEISLRFRNVSLLLLIMSQLGCEIISAKSDAADAQRFIDPPGGRHPQAQPFTPGGIPPGIPLPGFGIDETVESVYGDQNYYTHWVDNLSPNATDLNNPNGSPEKPRLNLPWMVDLPEGSVVQLRGGPYAPTNSNFRISGVGSREKPIFIRGGSPQAKVDIQRIIRVYPAKYIVFENIKQSGSSVGFDIRPASSANEMDWIVIRHCAIYGPGNGGFGYVPTGIPGRAVKNVVAINNYVTKVGNWSQPGENDRHSFGVGAYTENIWYGWNTTWENGGDAVGNGHNANFTAKNYYIFNNTFARSHENGIDLKEVDTVVISNNHIYEMTGRISDPGTAIAIHYGPDERGPRNVFIINNRLNNCRFGIGLNKSDNIFIANNIVHDIGWNKGPMTYETPNWDSTYAAGALIIAYDNIDLRIFNNTFYDYDKGIELPSAGGTTYVRNNIFAKRNVPSSYDWHAYHSDGRVSFDGNFFDILLSPVRLRWGTALLSAVTASNFGQEFEAQTGQVIFENADIGNFTLAANSEARSQGVEDEGWALAATFLNNQFSYRNFTDDNTHNLGAANYLPIGSGQIPPLE